MTSLVYCFTLSKGAIHALGALRKCDARERINYLLQSWKRNGVLVTNSGRSYLAELDQICRSESFPHTTRQQIREILSAPALPKMEVSDWPHCDNPPREDTRAPLQGSWFVGDQECEFWQIDEDHPTVTMETGIEICRIDGFSESRWHALKSSQVFERQRPIQDVLEVFRPVCGAAKVLDIVDPFCGKDEVVNPGRSGLLRYLTGLAKADKGSVFALRELRIYTSKNVPRSMVDGTAVAGPDIIAAWKAAAPSLHAIGFKRIVLHLVDGDKFSSLAHDRFAGFYDEECGVGRAGGMAFNVGSGFCVFEGKRLSKETTISMISPADVELIIRSLQAEASHEFREF